MKNFIGIGVLVVVLAAAAIVVPAIASRQDTASEYAAYLANPTTPTIGNAYVDPARLSKAETAQPPAAPVSTPNPVPVQDDPYGAYVPTLTTDTPSGGSVVADAPAAVSASAPAPAAGGLGAFGSLDDLPTDQLETCAVE
ncbi:MAG: hypothetical protein LBS11_09485 [Oscillospiraceae bacterium]|jgi:hypothetical protein|nr:hypothetical protein [Oscillospiraceae bacterium]